MNKNIKKAIAILSIAALLVPASNTTVVQASTTRQVESLNRGLVGVKSDKGVFLSWRLLGTDSYDTSFNVYRNGKKVAGPITNSTNYLDAGGSQNDKYFVRTVINGIEKNESDTISVWKNNYLDVPINKPGSEYSANDATVADVDGDGEYEIILKWDPSNSKDNSQSGYTSNVYIDCYEMDGTQKWRIDLGKNIRAGAHYTQFIAYDLNGDGKAEIAMKTADGTIAGDGTVIGDKSKDYRNKSGYILSGSEYLTLFEGETGKILDNIDFTPQRGNVSSWGDKYGNRVDRFLAGVAYLDGKTPSLIMSRGYYTRSVISAYKYKSGKLNKQWTFDSNDAGNASYAGQGCHSLSTADVDQDGCDEIIFGSAVINNDGKGLYSTKMGHGDALHVGDFDPNHAGLEIFQVHEEKGKNIESIQMRDAKTGKTIWAKKTGTDVGRGLIANIDPDYYPYVAMTYEGKFDKNGKELNINMGKFGANFAIWWDGDLYREGLDNTYINKWNYNTKSVDRLLTGANVHSNNTSKATPSLSGDILGDWREEVIWPTEDNKALRIYTTTDVSNNKLYTLMHDVQYREAIAWQNVGYNQPPHPSYYVGPDMKTPSQPNVYTVGKYKEKEVSGTQVSLQDGAKIKEGKYRIKNMATGRYLDVKDGTASNGTNVQQWSSNSPAPYNTWTLKSAGDNYYKIYSAVGNGSYLLDLDYGKTDDGTNIQIYQDTSSDAQSFKFVKADNNSYVIYTKASSDTSCLDLYNNNSQNGANVCQWKYNNSKSQMWLLEEVKDSNTENSNGSENKPVETPSNGSALFEYKFNDWGSSFGGDFKVTNGGNTACSSWRLKLKSSEFDIVSHWNASITKSGDELIVTPASWQAALQPNNSASFGFMANGKPKDKISYTLELLDSSGKVISSSSNQ